MTYSKVSQLRVPTLAFASMAAVASLVGCGSDSGPAIHEAAAQKALDQPVQHVFVIFKENHTYDNYFLGYSDPNEPNPPTQGMASNGRLVTITEPRKKDWSPGDNSFAVAHRDYDDGQNGRVRGVVQNERREHSSIAKFCERIFNLPSMSARDGDPQTDDLMSAFDFTQSPRPYSDFVPP